MRNCLLVVSLLSLFVLIGVLFESTERGANPQFLRQLLLLQKKKHGDKICESLKANI